MPPIASLRTWFIGASSRYPGATLGSHLEMLPGLCKSHFFDCNWLALGMTFLTALPTALRNFTGSLVVGEAGEIAYQSLMFPRPRQDLIPNTAEFERGPFVKATGFREYDARWLYPEEINLLGLEAVGLGLA